MFVRGVPDPPEVRLMVVNADGQNERILAPSKPPETLNLTTPAWSPDGRRVAATQMLLRVATEQRPVVIDFVNGTIQPLGTKRWLQVGDLAWLADGSTIVASATEQGATNRQLWRIAYPGGEATRITNDLTNYDGIGLAADSRALVTVQTETRTNVWVTPAGDSARAVQITSGTGRYDGLSGQAWAPDGRLVYDSAVNGNLDVWIMDADGGNQKQLTFDSAFDIQPAVTPDGRFVVFMSTRSGGWQIWRMGIDGADPAQLSAGDLSIQPVLTGDGKFVVYGVVASDGKQTVWRVPIDGGKPEKVSDHPVRTQAISPDGELISGLFWDAAGRRQAVAVATLGSPDPPKVFPIVPRALAWAPSGQALTYIDVKNGVGNIWIQPIAGGAPKQLTNFTSELIYNFAWLRDGKRLAVVRGTTSTDVVLMTAPK